MSLRKYFLDSIVLYSLISFFGIGYAQNNAITFQRISLEQGLSESIVTSIIQDSRGFIWFGTQDGLNVYDGYGFTVIRNDPNNPNSLSYNQIETIYEDRSGWLWIGTFNGGLNKHDPHKGQFIRYQNNPNDPNSLSNDIVRAIYEDRKGVFWIGTERGLNKLIPSSPGNEENVSFILYQHDPNDSKRLSHNTVRAICEDKEGTLWIGTDDGLNKLVLNSPGNSEEISVPTFIHYKHDPNNPNSLSHNMVKVIYEDKEGTLWIGTDYGLNKFVRNSLESGTEACLPIFIRYQHDPNNPNSLSHNEIYSIYEDQSGVLWIGTNGGGLNKFDRDNEVFTHYQNDPRDLTSLSYNEIRSIYEDRSGILWIGTYGGGINKVDKGKKQFVHYKPDPDIPNCLNEEIIWSIYEDRSGIIWIGTHGGGLNKFDRQRNQFTYYQHDPDDPSSLSNDVVRLVYEDRSGVLWLGTHGGGLNKFDRETEKFASFQHDPANPNSLSHNEIRAIYEDRSGVLWIGTRGGGLNKLILGEDKDTSPTFIHYRHAPDNPNSISNDFIRAIYEDRSGRYWIGTQGGGFNKFDRITETFTHYKANTDEPNSLSNDYVFAIHEDTSGILWLGTYGGGLNEFNPDKETFTTYTVKDGLPNDVVYGILEDNQGYLWLSTNYGLSKFDPQKKTFKNYNVSDGLQSNEFNGGAYFKSKSGELFFGGINGFNAFYPENIKDNPYIPPVVVTEFSKLNQVIEFDKPISEVKEIRLSYRDYIFSFEFAALDYTMPEKNQYAYKMEGLDKDWIYTDSKKRFANYTTLAPGKYIFRTKGSNNDGIWNEEGTSIEITITPLFWQTWWFQTLSVLCVVGIAYMLYRGRLKNVRLKTELQAAHDAQMSIMPHSDPQVAGFDISGICIPANEVGGDFFDYIRVDEAQEKFLIAIGDVSGKAMKAAMTAVMSSGMISLEAKIANSVNEIMTQVNLPLYLKTDKQMFIALCLALIDVNKKELIFTNAGLVEPLLKSDDSVEFIKAADPTHPLGIISDNVYHETKISLKSKDVLIFLTDGIPEAQNRGKELYGEKRLKDLIKKINTTDLSAREIKERIIEDVRQFSGVAPQHDDITVIVIKVSY